MFELVVIILAINSFIAFSDWRQGLLACIAVGFFQDPIRKLISGQPGYVNVLVIVVFTLVCVAMLNRGVSFRLAYLYGYDRRLRKAWQIFIALILIQSVMSLINFGNPMVSVMGIVTYFSPIAAMWAGYVYVRSPKDIEKFFSVYVLFAVPFALTVYLSYRYEAQWDVLKDIGAFAGTRLIIYDQGTVLYSYSGLLRAGEYAAWHAAMASIILFVFAMMKRSLLVRLLAGVLIALLIGVIILTGRRKMLLALSIFAGIYTYLLAHFWYGISRLTPTLIVLSVVVSTFMFMQSSDKSEQYYLGRSGTVFVHSGDRIKTTLDLVISAVKQGGIWGVGAGATAQGSQHFNATGDQRIRGASEAGVGKIIAELGVVGFSVVGWLVYRLTKHLFRLFRQTPRRFHDLTLWLSSLVSMLAANVAIFAVASQLYGDLFVLLSLGLWVGFLFSIERMVRQTLHVEALEFVKA